MEGPLCLCLFSTRRRPETNVQTEAQNVKAKRQPGQTQTPNNTAEKSFDKLLPSANQQRYNAHQWLTLAKGELMPQLPPYIPAKNAAFVAWLANFSALITASPATYGLASGDATTIAGINTTVAADYALITSGATKTAVTVQQFNTEKVNALATIRPYALQISTNAGVSSANKVAVGVNPRTSVPTPITTPTTAPALTAQSTSTAGTILRYRDATASPSVKSKPYGVTQMQLYGMTSATAITDPSLLPFLAVVTKSPLTITLPSGSAGKTAYFAARWQTRKGLLGPWSAIISYIVAA